MPSRLKAEISIVERRCRKSFLDNEMDPFVSKSYARSAALVGSEDNLCKVIDLMSRIQIMIKMPLAMPLIE